MADDEPLLEVAAALADGTAVDWDSAARSINGEENRRLLAELRFIAEVARPASADSSNSVKPGRRYSDARLSPGDFWGPLKIVEHVGRGSFGDLYRAWDRRLDREVALKILRHTDLDDPADAVIEEGRLLARVHHPNVVTVYGAERVDGRVGVWMEFVHGTTLEDQLAADGLFAVDRVALIGVELGRALGTIHRAGLIHRDVKARNVLCARDQRLVLTDFGAGCEFQDTTEAATRELTGTPLYVAPEVLAGQPASPSSDLYSLGVLLYHLVTGTYPVRGRTLEEIRDAHARLRRTPLGEARPDLPPAFVRAIERAIDSDPSRRYETADALASDLASLAEPGLARGAPTATRANGRRRSVIAAIAIIGVAAIGFAIASRLDDRGGDGARRAAVVNAEIELVEIVSLTEHGRFEDAFERAHAARLASPTSPAAACAVAYALTYAGFLDHAARAVDDVLTADPDFITNNAWWAPTPLLYQRNFDRFLHSLRNVDTSSARLYRALAETERGRVESAVPYLLEIEAGGSTVFAGLGLALHAALTHRRDVSASVQSIDAQRRAGGDRDGEMTFKQAQILSAGGEAGAALAMLDEAVTQGFVCLACFETSMLLERVRALPGYSAVRERARARQLAFGQRFGLTPPR